MLVTASEPVLGPIQYATGVGSPAAKTVGA